MTKQRCDTNDWSSPKCCSILLPTSVTSLSTLFETVIVLATPGAEELNWKQLTKRTQTAIHFFLVHCRYAWPWSNSDKISNILLIVHLLWPDGSPLRRSGGKKLETEVINHSDNRRPTLLNLIVVYSNIYRPNSILFLHYFIVCLFIHDKNALEIESPQPIHRQQ